MKLPFSTRLLLRQNRQMASAPSSTTTIKKALRKDVRSRLSALETSEIEQQSKEVTDKIVQLPEFEQATRISVYLSMPTGEISTTGIVKQALVQGKKVFVPFIRKSSDSNPSHPYMEMFALCSQADADSLQPDSWGIPTLDEASLQVRENAMGGFGPSAGAPDSWEGLNLFVGLHLILLPGVAFDYSGGRLGHGMGFYDHFLQCYWRIASRKDGKAKMPNLVGLALKQQLLPPGSSVPMDALDWRLDSVIASV